MHNSELDSARQEKLCEILSSYRNLIKACTEEEHSIEFWKSAEAWISVSKDLVEAIRKEKESCQNLEV